MEMGRKVSERCPWAQRYEKNWIAVRIMVIDSFGLMIVGICCFCVLFFFPFLLFSSTPTGCQQDIGDAHMTFRTHRVHLAPSGAFPASLGAGWPGDGKAADRAKLNMDMTDVCACVPNTFQIFLHFLLSLIYLGHMSLGGREERTSVGNEWGKGRRQGMEGERKNRWSYCRAIWRGKKSR